MSLWKVMFPNCLIRLYEKRVLRRNDLRSVSGFTGRK